MYCNGSFNILGPIISSGSVSAAAAASGFFINGSSYSGGYYFAAGLNFNPNWNLMQVYGFHWPGVYAAIRLGISGIATWEFQGNGLAYQAGGGLWQDVSDARIKTIVRDYGSGLAAVLFKPFKVDQLLSEIRKAISSRTHA